MSTASLTARYRPQCFAEVAGQRTLKTILSRAAAEDKVAPAYLFSGTRGVGKTTIARIFAKALNCRNAPTAEPCNQCDQCRAITQGSSVDVVEIDGASNRGIDDVRRLKESVGYAPMEGRYKVFIIDEAHMLSREAFNALLKTLEEPPARVTFIMATTEPHKFPVTIISRCQHFVFKRLSDQELEAHLKNVLSKENKPYEQSAVHLLARRAAGSVRDGMSLLGQVLALGGEELKEADTRSVLGLAGQELFFNLIAAIQKADCGALSVLVRQMLDEGLDLGFFLRELTQVWRNLFMLKQVGENAAELVDLPETESHRWLETSRNIDLAYIHAAWQMTLEGQRRVLTSLEPSLALELLLFNLAQLPRLLSLEQLSTISRKLGAQPTAEKKTLDSGETRLTLSQTAPTGSDGSRSSIESKAAEGRQNSPRSRAATTAGVPFSKQEIPDEIRRDTAAESFENHTGTAAILATPHAETIGQEATGDSRTPNGQTEPKPPFAPDREIMATQAGQPSPSASLTPSSAYNTLPHSLPPNSASSSSHAGATHAGSAQSGEHWDEFIHFCSQDEQVAPSFMGMLKNCEARWSGNALELTPKDNFTAGRLQQSEALSDLARLMYAFDGSTCPVTLLPVPQKKQQDRSEIAEKVQNMSIVKDFQDNLGAEIVDYGPWYQ